MHYCKTIFLFVSLSIGFSLSAQTWLSGFQNRKQITLNGADISGNHTNFPILFQLASDADLAADARTDGYDIAFSDSDGSTQLNHELISYTSGSGAITAYVQVDLTNATNKTIYMYYGNSNITTDQSSTATWDSNFQAVLHLQESGGGTDDEFVDSSVNGVHGTGGGLAGAGAAGSTPTQTTGKFGFAQDFDGSDDRIRLQAIDDNTWTSFTIQVWVNPDDGGDDRVFGKCWGTGADDETWLLRQTGGNIGSRTNVNNGGTDNDLTLDDDGNPIAYNTGTWYLAAYTWDAADNTARVYLNGTQVNSGGLTGDDLSLNAEASETDNATIGNIPGGGRDFNGQIQEARVSDVARSANWLLTQFNIEDDPSGFISMVASEETSNLDGGIATAALNEVFSGNSTIITLSDFTASGTTLQWQSSADGVSFSDVTGGSGATALNYTTDNLTSDTYFRCIVDDASHTVASTLALVAVKTEFSSGAGPAGYSLRRKLTIDNTQVAGSADHTNFPVLIRLAGSKLVSDLIYAGNGGDVAHQNGYDIIFTESDGTTELDHQIEHYDPATGEYIGWVMVPTLSYNSDTEIFMYYGNPDVSTDPSDNIFDSDYVGTWHLHDQYDDAVSTGNDGVAFGSVTNDSGIIGNGARISPVDGDDFSRIEIGDFDPDATDITLSAWFNRETSNDGVGDARIISKSDGQASNAHVFMLSLLNGNDIRLRLTGTEADDSNAETLERTSNVNFSPGTWVYAAFTYTANGNVIMYEDGVQVDSHPELNDREKIEQATGFKVALGNNPGPADGGNPNTRKPFDGVIDEVRVASVVRSGDWLLTEYNNQQENSTFCSVGDEEGCDVAGGTVSVVDENIFTGESTTLSTSGSSGSLQWQSSTDNVTFTDIGSATNATYNTTSLTQTTYFRVKATSGTCTSVSNVVTVNVQGRFLSNYAYRKSIVIDKDKVAGSTNLSEFPLLVSITDSDLATIANGGNVYDTDNGNGTLGDDITFTDASGNELTQYRESYDDASGALVVWVKIPTLSATQDTEIFIYYGNCLGTGLPNLFNTNTWNNDSNSDDYAAVWLMNDGTPTTVVDATANNLDGTGNGLTASTMGQIDGAIDFESGDTNDNFTYSSYTSSGGALTVSAWVNPESLAGGVGDDAIVLSHTDFVLKTIVADLAVDENEFSFEVTTTGGAVSVESLPSDLTAGSFIMVTGVYDGSNVIIYENGNEIASAAQTGNLNGSNSDILIGNNAVDGLPFDGLIDHVTILPAARTADWVRTMYNNQSDPGAFYTYASSNEESQVTWVGGASGAETDFNNANNWSNCAVPATTESIILETGLTHYPVLTQNTQVVDLIIEAGASFGLGGFELTVTGRLTNSGTFTHSNGKVTFAGTAEQQISGSSATTLYDVEVNNSGNEVRIETSTTIENTVTLTSGFITISDNPLVITSTGEISGGSSSSFFITEGAECLEQEGIGSTGRTGDILFPIGISSLEYTPLTINNIGTEDDYCIRVADNVYSGGTTGSGVRLTSNQIDKTWFISEAVVGGSNVTMTIQWNIADELVGFDRTDMFIRHYTSDWVNYESGITASNPSTDVYSASTAGVTSFSPVGGGSGDGPLPIELINFDVSLSNENVSIEWSTASETNNDYFSIYRSRDGSSFSEIGRIEGAGNSSDILKYSWVDENPHLGINYYYLRQTDFDGVYENSEIKSVILSASDLDNPGLTLYPNPSSSGSFTLVGTGFQPGSEILMSVRDMSGKIIHSQLDTSKENGSITIQNNLEQPSGIYFIVVQSHGESIERKLIIKN